MEFTIFKKTGERHIERHSMDDYDGNNGYYDEIDIPDEQVHDDVIDMIIGSYFIQHFSNAELKPIKQSLHSLLSDMDCYDKAIKMYHDDLQDKYEREFNHGK